MGEVTITEHLLQRLKQGGIDHILGYPATMCSVSTGSFRTVRSAKSGPPAKTPLPSAAMRRLGEHLGRKSAG